MSRKSRTADRLEEELNRDREALADTLKALARDLPVDRWIGDAARLFGSSGGEIGRQLGRAVRNNPGASAVTGAGLALAVYGAVKMLSHREPRVTDAELSFDERLRVAEEALREEATGLWDGEIDEPVASAADTIRDRLAEIAEGLDLDTARDRASDAAQAAAGSVERNPVAYGVGALALGAVAAALLSRGESEETRLRRKREALISEARALYDLERRRLREAARAAAEEAQGAARKVGQAARKGYRNSGHGGRV